MNDERAAFEHWMTHEAKIIVGSQDPYPAGLERDYWNVWQAGAAASKAEVARLTAECDALRAALRNIAEGNLGDQPWQANYDRIRAVAVAAISADNPTTRDETAV